VRWQVPVAAPGSSLQLSPLAFGAVAVFAQGDVIYGLRLADGHRVWSRAGSQDIAGMRRWQNLVVVLTEPASSVLPLPLLLTGLDAGTGQVVGPGRASPALPVFPAGPLLIVPAVGLDGSNLLAALRMSDGHRAWQVTIPAPVEAPLSAVPGGMLVYTAAIPLPC